MVAPPDDDIDAWVRNLGETGSPNAESEALRRVIRAHAQRQPSVAAGDDAAWERLRFRLRGERLVRGGRPAWRVWVPAAAVAILAIAFGLQWFMPPSQLDMPVSQDAPPTLRGGPAAQELVVVDPLRAARRAASIVAAHDGRPVLYSQAQGATVDFEADGDQAPTVQADLRREWPQVNVQPGLNRLAFVRRP